MVNAGHYLPTKLSKITGKIDATAWQTITPEITAHKLQLGKTTVESGNSISCPIHGNDVGISITAEANDTTPTMKLVACRFCMLNKLAKGL